MLRALRASFDTPIYFIRGNHEDRAWLSRLPRDPTRSTAAVDPCDFFRFVPTARSSPSAGSGSPSWAGARRTIRTRAASIARRSRRYGMGLGRSTSWRPTTPRMGSRSATSARSRARA
jgi:hypothetical protein